MRGTLAAIALLGFSGAASAASADDSETERATLLRIISEGTAAIAAAAACGVEEDHIDRRSPDWLKFKYLRRLSGGRRKRIQVAR